MLTPEEIARLSEGSEEIASQLHTEILSRVVKAIITRLDRGDDYILTARDKWMLEVLRDAGILYEQIQEEIANYTGLQLQEIKEAFEDAGVKAFDYDTRFYQSVGLLPPDEVINLPDGNVLLVPPQTLQQSPYYIRLMQRNYEATHGEWRNMTRTTADAAQQLFIRECDKAYNLASTGAVSLTEAVKNAVDSAVKDGLRVVYTDESGNVYHSDTIEVATARAVRTGVSQACSEITDKRMEEMDWDIILVSAHLGARYGDGGENHTNHFWWQGKFYSRTGREKKFPLFEVCGEGKVQGFAGPNCRHNKGPGDGVNNPFEKFDSEENKKAYDLSQRQRLLERRIRKSKSDIMALRTARDSAKTDELRESFDREYQRKSALLQKQNRAYNEFCEQNGLKRLQDRLRIAKWDRKQAAAATAAARKYKTDFTARNNNATIKTVSGARITDHHGKAADEHADRYYGLVRSMKNDATKIARTTGFSEDDILRVKSYIFVDEHDLGGIQPERFAPSFSIAQSWQRLIDGKPEPHDITLIQHEVMERGLG